MKSKTSPSKVSITDSDTISNDGLQEGLIAFQLLEMGAPCSERQAAATSIQKLESITDDWIIKSITG